MAWIAVYAGTEGPHCIGYGRSQCRFFQAMYNQMTICRLFVGSHGEITQLDFDCSAGRYLRCGACLEQEQQGKM